MVFQEPLLCIMKIGGLQKLSLIDFPDNIAAIIFTQGCNFRCPYCHNPELVDPQLFQEPISEEEVISFLETRKEKLTGVVITGGEPVLQEDLGEFMQKLKTMGFKVKLDTNGSRPEVLKQLMESQLLDYIAMDIKAPLEKYPKIAGVEGMEDKVKESIDLIKASEVPHEFRTTVAKNLLDPDDIEQIKTLAGEADKYYTKDFVKSEKLLDPDFTGEN